MAPIYLILARPVCSRLSTNCRSGRRFAVLAWALLACLALSSAPQRAWAGTLVSFNFNVGTVEVDLFNGLTPTTVSNFLQYVNGNAWDNSVIHRATTVGNTGLAVVQGGGFTYSDAAQNFAATQSFGLIPLEYSRANSIGTIAMARYYDQANPSNTTTASNQWFFNTSDNSTVLNQSNGGGYAVFGWIVGPGLSVVDQIDGIGTGGCKPITSARRRFTTATTSGLFRRSPPTRPPNSRPTRSPPRPTW